MDGIAVRALGVRARCALALVLCSGLVQAAGAAPATAATPTGAQSAAVAARTTCSTAAFGNDKRLGPKRLPTAGPIAKLLRGWKRLAGLSPRAYLRRYYDAAAKSWRFPPKGGYQLTPLGTPVIGSVSLIAGQQIDRFGGEGGTYLSPLSTPYLARGIPPESLNPFPGGRPCNYYRYEVVTSFPVDSGPIAPALGQPGLGLQYVLNGTLFPGVTERVDVSYLLANGYLRAMPSRRPASASGTPRRGA